MNFDSQHVRHLFENKTSSYQEGERDAEKRSKGKSKDEVKKIMDSWSSPKNEEYANGFMDRLQEIWKSL